MPVGRRSSRTILRGGRCPSRWAFEPSRSVPNLKSARDGWSASSRVPGRVVEGPVGSGYLLPYATNQANRAINRLFGQEAELYWTSSPITVGSRRFGPGTVFVPRAYRNHLGRIARDLGLTFYPVSEPVEADGFEMRQPRVGLYRSFKPSMDEGWTRFVLEEFEFAYRNLYDRDIRSPSLGDRYDVVVFSGTAGWRGGRGSRAGFHAARIRGRNRRSRRVESQGISGRGRHGGDDGPRCGPGNPLS